MSKLTTQKVEYKDGDLTLEGYVAYDSSKSTPLPAVIICHAFAGRTQFECKKAEALAELGYIGFAADLYGGGKTGSNPEENMKLMKPFLDDRKMLINRLEKVLATVKSLPFVNKTKVPYHVITSYHPRSFLINCRSQRSGFVLAACAF